MSDAVAVSPFVRALGLALLQFLWQGAVLGLITAALLAMLRRQSSSVRYLIACAGLTAMLIAPVVMTASYLRATPAQPVSSTPAAEGAISTPAVARNAVATSIPAPALSVPVWRTWIEARLPVVVAVWMGGVLVLALHLFRGWRTIGLIRRDASAWSDPYWLSALQRIADRLGVRRSVRLIESVAVDVPSVIGWLRPAIVLPVSTMAGLAPSHLEAILAHELAHIRRGDYLVNILQRIVETLLFYQPAVWWVSRQVRIEREHCCDDLVVSYGTDRVAYADALTSLEELRSATPSLAMGANGGDLLQRVRRLVEPGHESNSQWSGGFAMSVVLTVLLLTVGAHLDGTTRDTQQLTPPAPKIVTVTPVVVAPRVFPPVTIERAKTSAPTVKPVVVAPQGVPVVVQRATLSGVIKTQTGGVIPGVTVTLTSSMMTGSRVAITNTLGKYTLNDLAPGSYDVSATLQGFKTYRDRVLLSANQSATLNVEMQVGSLSETIQVTGVNTVTSTGPLPDVSGLTTASEFYDAAKAYYLQQQFAEAERLTNRALELMRAEAAANPAPVRPPQLVNANGVQIVRVGGNIKEPKIIKRVEPIYPTIAQVAKVQGYVIVEAIIATDGTVREAKIIKPAPLLDEAALGAVRQWRYSPTILDGQPVEVVMSVTVIFSLPKGGGR